MDKADFLIFNCYEVSLDQKDIEKAYYLSNEKIKTKKKIKNIKT